MKHAEKVIHNTLDAHEWVQFFHNYSRDRICLVCGKVEWAGFGEWNPSPDYNYTRRSRNAYKRMARKGEL